jgi:hypothetical protein
MALATDLDIHKKARELLELASDVQANIRRSHRNGVGGRIMSECVDMLTLIRRANAARDPARRAASIEELLERLDTVADLLRTAHDHKLRLIDHGLWARGIRLIGDIGRQAGGWLKSARAGNARTSAAPAAWRS